MKLCESAMNKAAAARSYPTRERILEAAIQRFARKSYEETGLRDIAADAEVDVAYVHRSFGSKEQLFAEAVRASTGVARILAEAPEDLCRHLAKQAFDRDREASTAQIGPLDIIIHSLSSPAAVRVVREFIVGEFVNPLGSKLDDPAALRAAVIGSLLVGIGILRNVLDIEPLREPAGGNLENLLATTIAQIRSANLNAGSETAESQDI